MKPPPKPTSQPGQSQSRNNQICNGKVFFSWSYRESNTILARYRGQRCVPIFDSVCPCLCCRRCHQNLWHGVMALKRGNGQSKWNYSTQRKHHRHQEHRQEKQTLPSVAPPPRKRKPAAVPEVPVTNTTNKRAKNEEENLIKLIFGRLSGKVEEGMCNATCVIWYFYQLEAFFHYDIASSFGWL